MPSITQNLSEVRESVAAAARAVGRDPASVKLLAVSKTFPSEAVLEAYGVGQRLFGENHAQEIEAKAAILPKDIEWHFIGHLQGNKVGRVVEVAAWIHSVDSTRLLDRIDLLAGERGRCPNILLEVNISGEETKHGLRPAGVLELARSALAKSHLRLGGLMTMAPYGAPREQLEGIFSGLRELRGEIERKLGVSLPELSMGMSGDYPEAIAQGATIVRVGSAIFGTR